MEPEMQESAPEVRFRRYANWSIVSATGPIEMEALGFKFRGASGPVVLRIFCFLVIVFGVYLLWNK